MRQPGHHSLERLPLLLVRHSVVREIQAFQVLEGADDLDEAPALHVSEAVLRDPQLVELGSVGEQLPDVLLDILGHLPQLAFGGSCPAVAEIDLQEGQRLDPSLLASPLHPVQDEVDEPRADARQIQVRQFHEGLLRGAPEAGVHEEEAAEGPPVVPLGQSEQYALYGFGG